MYIGWYLPKYSISHSTSTLRYNIQSFHPSCRSETGAVLPGRRAIAGNDKYEGSSGWGNDVSRGLSQKEGVDQGVSTFEDKIRPSNSI